MGKGKTQFYIIACFGFLCSCYVELTGGTECYQCFSWKDSGCEEDYMNNVNLTTCGSSSVSAPSSSSYWRGERDRDQEYRDRVLNAPPYTCIKQVIVFINPPIRTQNDRYNRFNRPWVERKCGLPIQAGYRQGKDLIDDCEETEVVIEGVAGIRKTCACTTDGCNSADSLKRSNIVYGLIGMLCILQLAPTPFYFV